MFYLVWQMGVFLLLAFLGGLFVGWMAWGSAGRNADVDNAVQDNARLRAENENLARRLGEAEARKPVAEVQVESSKSGAAALPDAVVSEPAPEKPAKPAKAKKPAAKPAAKPASAPAAKASDDDLNAIKGLGPKAAAALKAGGVTSYAQLAAWTNADIADWDARINGRGRIQRDDWVGQAKALAKALAKD